MLPGEPQITTCNRVRVDVQAKIPGPEVLQGLTPADLRLLRRTLADPAEYIPNAWFDSADAERVLMQPVPPAGMPAGRPPLGGDDSGLHRLGAEDEAAATPPDREQRLFLRLNYARRRVAEILGRCSGRRLAGPVLEELLRWQREVQETRGQIVRENMPLVLAMAKRTRINNVDPSDMISEGNLALLRAANKFDCARGYRFSTYACRAILKSFSRVATRTARYRGHFPTEFDPTLEKSNYVERRRMSVEDDCVDELRSLLDDNIGQLSAVERQVIRARFALDEPQHNGDGKGKTLEQVGELVGVTKERVRQIQNKALEKLRTLLDRAVLA